MDTDFDNKLIDHFEDEIKEGKSPTIESYLSLWPEESRPGILLELIAIELFHSDKKGRRVTNSDYGRFGGEAENYANRLREQYRTLDGPKMASLMRYKKSAIPSADG